jgi:hypothetical protein
MPCLPDDFFTKILLFSSSEKQSKSNSRRQDHPPHPPEEIEVVKRNSGILVDVRVVYRVMSR